jgi:hypothetical protein
LLSVSISLILKREYPDHWNSNVAVERDMTMSGMTIFLFPKMRTCAWKRSRVCPLPRPLTMPMSDITVDKHMINFVSQRLLAESFRPQHHFRESPRYDISLVYSVDASLP